MRGHSPRKGWKQPVPRLTSLLMCLGLPLPLLLLWPLRPAAPETPAEQQDQEDGGRSWHCGGPERIHFSGARGDAPAQSPGPGL